MPYPSSGSSPSSQTTGSSATPTASRVSFSERQYSHSITVVIAKAMAKNSTTPSRPSITSPMTLAKPTI
ncbi:hypothetical protein D3C80_2130260 [compost metagenome]